MADVNIFADGKATKPGLHRIQTTRIFDLTNGLEGVSVVMKSKRSIVQSDDASEAKRLKDASEKSPWRDDSLGKAFANKSLRSRKLKDPIAELKLFTDTITRG